MADIEINVFEVQLGAAILLQMKDSRGRTVNVLADGGINAAKYSQDHVAIKLGTLLPSQRIDVLIGTHYDQDHLAGLIDAADQFPITEAILPPIRKPRYPKSRNGVNALWELGNSEDASDLPLLIELNDGQFEEHIAELEELSFFAGELLRDVELIDPKPPNLETEVLGSQGEFDSEDLTLPLSSDLLASSF
jgi:hypothetical protein